MDQMDVSVDVTVTKVEADIIDDGIPMEDIDDMEIDFFFSKYDDLDLDTAKKNDIQKKTTDIIKLSDDEEECITKDVPKDKVQKSVENIVKTVKKKPIRLRRIPHRLPVIKIPKSQANRRFKIAIQSNIEIRNNDISSVQPPTVAYTVSTTPVKTKPKSFVVEKKDNLKTLQTKYVKDLHIIKKLNKKETEDSNFPQNNKILVSLLTQKTKPLTLKPVKVKPTKELTVETNYLKYLKKLAETPSTSKGTWSEPPRSDEKNRHELGADFKAKRVMINKELSQDIINVEEIKTNELEYRVSNVGGFKAVHDASGAIVEMIEETPNSPHEEIHEILETSDEFGESQKNINFIDMKLLAVTTVQLDDWSVVLSNSTRYCSLCQTLFPSRAVLDEHQAQWHPLLVPCVEEEGYYCQHCDTSFHDKTSLETHSQTHQNTSHTLTNIAKFGCFICRKRFVSQRAFDAHVNARHMQNLNCHCGKEFPLRELLDDHIKTVHTSQPSAETTSDGPRDRGLFPDGNQGQDQAQKILVQTTALFKCESCKVHFTYYDIAKDHYARCKKTRRISRKKCSRCQKLIAAGSEKFHQYQHNLKCHLRTYTVNSKNLNVISECPKCFLHLKIHSKGSLIRHVKKCKRPKEVFAECCGLKFTEVGFRNHIKEHDANRDFILVKYCFYEPKQSSRKWTMSKNGRTKSPEPAQLNSVLKPFAPQVRDDTGSFGSPFKLNKREIRGCINLVQITALFECELCKASFTSYPRAQKHYNQCKNDTKLKVCPHCNKFINSTHHMYQHLMGCKLKSYTVNANELCVLSECPKCRLHFNPQNFILHANLCNGQTKSYSNYCGLKISKHQFSFHKIKHQNSDGRKCIVLKYMFKSPSEEEPALEPQKSDQGVKPNLLLKTENQDE